jgi:apolipoprotein N-acyltransferase
MSKIGQYFTTLEIIRGLLIALLGSLMIYLHHWDINTPILDTLLALGFFALLLASPTKVWIMAGAFTGVLWFWWIAISFVHYEMEWAIPLVLVLLALIYGVLFGVIGAIGDRFSALFGYLIKSLGLLSLSLIHPFGFNWYKPELLFVQSYFAIDTLSFAIILLALSLTLYKKNPLYLLLLLFSLSPYTPINETPPPSIALINTAIPVHEKWNAQRHTTHFNAIFTHIDKAIEQNKRLIIFPETTFTIFLNRDAYYLERLKKLSRRIAIVVGGLHLEEGQPRNSTYIFDQGSVQVAHKVLLVPFGEANPLPKFLSRWVNEIFYDGAIDYEASEEVVDYEINGTRYRNAICFEATAQRLYERDAHNAPPKQMIVLSNNGWFVPSTQPTLQKLLLLYYHRLYGTTIYHAINMSQGYAISSPKSP